MTPAPRSNYESVPDVINHETPASQRKSRRTIPVEAALVLAAATLVLFAAASRTAPNYLRYDNAELLLGSSKEMFEPAQERCDYVVNLFQEKNAGKPIDLVIESYATQSSDFNVFYRATAEIFWKDFVANAWDDAILAPLSSNKLDDKSTWTWITGDQHLSNFGAWHNRGQEVVFGVNDFDEAAVYDFHVDVIRLAVSICNHAKKNGFSKKVKAEILQAFTDTYVKTVIDYVGNEEALTFELTTKTSKGILKKFLKDVQDDNSHEEQLAKYTDKEGSFKFNDKTRLAPVSPDLELEIKKAFTSQQYGATMMKTGWHVPKWNNDYFNVTDVARRLGAGVGSYGVDRYYVLLKGSGGKGQVILDVKYEPSGAVSKVLSADDAAWYNVLFNNEADRAVQGQRRLTSYVDPFTGWAQINGQAFVVRERSPWKDSPDLDDMTDSKDFKGFIKMVAIATATSHTRGTQAKAPGEFKQVIASVLGSKSARKKWGKSVAKVAELYHEQVLLDFDCFKSFVDLNYTTKQHTSE